MDVRQGVDKAIMTDAARDACGDRDDVGEILHALENGLLHRFEKEVQIADDGRVDEDAFDFIVFVD